MSTMMFRWCQDNGDFLNEPVSSIWRATAATLEADKRVLEAFSRAVAQVQQAPVGPDLERALCERNLLAYSLGYLMQQGRLTWHEDRSEFPQPWWRLLRKQMKRSDPSFHSTQNVETLLKETKRQIKDVSDSRTLAWDEWPLQEAFQAFAKATKKRRVGKRVRRTALSTLTAGFVVQVPCSVVIPFILIPFSVNLGVSGTMLALGHRQFTRGSKEQKEHQARIEQLLAESLSEQTEMGDYKIGRHSVSLDYGTRQGIVDRWCRDRGQRKVLGPYRLWLSCKDNFQWFIDQQHCRGLDRRLFRRLLETQAGALHWQGELYP